jgi:thiol:disulfide interchange protein DsbD
MVRLRQALAFPLYATAAWLVWVLAQLAGTDAMLPALAAFVLVGLAAWLAGLAPAGGRGRAVASGLALASLAGAGLAMWPAATGTPPAAVTPARAAALAEPFSPGRLAALQAEGRPVFVNVTAAWCITCKVNERVALATGSFRDLLARTGTVYLEADWTRRDPDVSHYIETFGRAGVPLYVYYPAGAAPEVLPQILTPATLEDVLG